MNLLQFGRNFDFVTTQNYFTVLISKKLKLHQ